MLQSFPIPKTTESRTHTEFASWTSGFILSRSENIHRRAKYAETRRSRYEETRRGNVDYRFQDILHSTVQKEDSNRKEIVKRLIQQLENQPNRDSLMEDLNKTG